MLELATWAAKLLPYVLGLLDRLIAIRKETETAYPDVWENVTQPGYVDASDAYAKKMAGEE